ncbi:MAG: YgeY family selenium metabolism-linked hydrolase [Dehalococcoidales bacterium]|nr:YgeY family selenium metabolism-linked hydrolase [Dehalococcoidales bacterium]
MSIPNLKEASARIADDVVAFTQSLVRTPSISGREQDVARLIISEMERLRYDEVFTDDMGNVVGIIRGSGQGENIMFNGHMDHVDAGRLEAWEHDPYGGTIAGGYLYGRGTCDMKGAIAAQVYAASLVKRLGLVHRGDILVTGVVQEEPAECLGMAHLCDMTLSRRGIKVGSVVLGEPTDLKLVLGHKGRVELEVTTVGRTSHGSAPWRGINAVYKMLPVLNKIQLIADTLPSHELLGKSTIALTIISCSPGQLSVIPDLCAVSLDRRPTPGETADQALARIATLLEEVRQEDPEFQGSARIREVEEISYTGMKTRARKLMLPWLIPAEHPGVTAALAALSEVGQQPELAYWDFATDGSHTAAVLGIPTIGYGPGEESLAHTPRERINLDSLVQSVAGNAAIALALSQ